MVAWMAVLFLAVQAPIVALAVPLDEIRHVFREKALHSPPEAALTALGEEDLLRGLQGLDPYARLFRPGEYRSPMSGPEAWIGIGAALVPGPEGIFLSVFRGGPADRTKIPERSRILEIDGKDVAGLTPEEVARRLRGEEGTSVCLEVLPPGGTPRRFIVRREAFRPLDVETEASQGQRVVRIREFAAGLTRPALLATLEFLERHPSAGGGGVLVMDLRDAGGGDLYEALDMAALFLQQGALIGTIVSAGGTAREVRAPSGDKLDMPMILLVGPDTASAAEIFAGTLQASGRAKLLGRRTYGKCVSQTDSRLSDGSVLRYTNLEILLPGGASCTDYGLAPDTEVDETTLGDLEALLLKARSLFPDL
jgi:carboxyl-terminal processing protease